MIETAEKEYDYSVVEGIKVSEFKPLPKHVMVRWMKKTETKGGILLPQNRQRARFAKGVILAVGEDCSVKLKPGVLITFDVGCEKEWVGIQDPHDRDTVFVSRHENVFGVISYDKDGIPEISMAGDWILIKPDEAKSEKSGLIVSDPAKDAERWNSRGWTGIAINRGEKVDSCEQGDRVMYETYGAKDLLLGDHNGVPHICLMNDFILGSIDKEEDSSGAN